MPAFHSLSLASLAITNRCVSLLAFQSTHRLRPHPTPAAATPERHSAHGRLRHRPALLRAVRARARSEQQPAVRLAAVGGGAGPLQDGALRARLERLHRAAAPAAWGAQRTARVCAAIPTECDAIVSVEHCEYFIA